MFGMLKQKTTVNAVANSALVYYITKYQENLDQWLEQNDIVAAFTHMEHPDNKYLEFALSSFGLGLLAVNNVFNSKEAGMIFDAIEQDVRTQLGQEILNKIMIYFDDAARGVNELVPPTHYVVDRLLAYLDVPNEFDGPVFLMKIQSIISQVPAPWKYMKKSYRIKY
ncbi:hypothetical protein M3194_15625 [Paenibacillus glycanilyticus]|uniref:hypothetical protein n=1 Tax=Paenibacillus glycanilyticus TaxID=126569 RepID=UPI00203DB467|nr:hypothetical protein [Paenibacillus glycanilyticus]MCM3628773.1 hypothetical protein [Paenibacillus glycanilyticus]